MPLLYMIAFFFHKRIAFEKLYGINVLPLWFFHSDKENVDNTKRIVRHLKNNFSIDDKISKNLNILGMNNDKWYGCFGVQSYINLTFLQNIENKYGITKLIPSVTCRSDRCCLERIFGVIFSLESKSLNRKSLFGNIMEYQKWGYSYDDYMNDLKNGHIPKSTVKIWTGR